MSATARCATARVGVLAHLPCVLALALVPVLVRAQALALAQAQALAQFQWCLVCLEKS